ncbi:bacteriocin, lactococcin 972 family [Cellulomonas flavigena DSM 20109]|uniref:Bacteriocin, lactococcin 972 family n=1 Tax=Cellulomonas flavigena (strain ATCC 482 / DSM 20109 / BCRC 11376 / JCM 18109 / NBRC 3775 / NCIMB 8073 / NRS 134) TaxID=446466 RepID=D5UBI2_CELFN|nr:lactococcin 972 family bacteriocin [Cellulomonas flavigena]ADG74077.1 bacteriocin, lactococcin 972 family [Cellulomonas flavigena DSM 20109]
MAARGTTRGPSRTRRALLTVALALGVAVSGGTAAYAVVVSAGGGTWHYGGPSLTPSYNWSNYLHPTKDHASSVTGDRGLVRSECRAPEVWSKASAWDSNPFRQDQAYWHYC